MYSVSYEGEVAPRIGDGAIMYICACLSFPCRGKQFCNVLFQLY